MDGLKAGDEQSVCGRYLNFMKLVFDELLI